MNLQKRLLSLSNVIILAFLLATASNLQAQVGIASTSITPDASAMLEVRSSSKGFLGPKVALTGTADVSTVLTPATGLLVYNTATAGTAPNDVTPGFYYYDGSSWVRIATGTTSGGLLGVQVLTSGTSYTPTAGTKAIMIEMVGGGGAGGGSSTTKKKTVSVGAGGGAGGYLSKYITGISAGPYTYAIGAAGAGSSGANGGNGGSTSITVGATTYTATGGTGGTGGVVITADGDDANTISSGGAGGTGSNGAVNSNGQSGGNSQFFVTKTFGFSGAGGSIQLGTGGASIFVRYPGDNVSASSAGNNATGYGAGGGGSVSKPASDGLDARAGGSGGSGVIIIYEYN